MDFITLQTYLQQVHAATRRSRSRTENSSECKLVSRISIVQAAGAWAFCLGVLALSLTLPCKCGVGATTFAISGFKKDDVCVVGDSSWILNSSAQCFYYGSGSRAGRFLHPGLVQMKDPGATTVKSFSTSFIYQLRAKFQGFYGPGMASIMVLDNVTIGAPEGYMGILTTDTPYTSKKYESDNYTFAVELDTRKDKMFDDINNNHIGINLASMISSYSIKPDLILASQSIVQHQQIWIEYSEATSTMDIYSGYYGQGKPDKPQGSQLLVDLSYLKESMYIGFSAARGIDTPTICAWSFSNDGIPPPPIYIGHEAPPASLPPPPGMSHPPPPGLRPQTPPPSPAKAPPPPSPVPSTSSPSSCEHAAPPAGGLGGENLATRIGIRLIVAGIVVFVIWWVGLRRTFRVFISNTGGVTGLPENFSLRLHGRLKKKWWFKIRFRLKVFIDKEDLPRGLFFPEQIEKELGKFDLGIVVVSDEYFRNKWPMTELIAFVEAQKKQPKSNRRSRVLPLFYGLTCDEVRQHLEEKKWENDWQKMAQGDHPLDVKNCREAVIHLCALTGIEYPYAKRDRDEEYNKSVIEEVEKILCKERSCASDFWWAIPACIERCRRTPAQKCARPQIQMTNSQRDEDAGECAMERHLLDVDDQELQQAALDMGKVLQIDGINLDSELR